MTYFFNGESIIINKYDLISEEFCETYDIFDTIQRTTNKTAIKEFSDTNVEYKNSFKNFLNLNNKKIVFSFDIRSDKEQEVILCLVFPANTKLWLNGQLLIISGKNSTNYIKTTLRKSNKFILEFYDVKENDSFSIRISDFNKELSLKNEYLLSNLTSVNFNSFSYVINAENCINYDNLELLFISNNKKSINDKILIDIFDGNLGYQKSIECKFEEKIVLNLNEFKNKSDYPLRELSFYCKTKDRFNNEITSYFSILIKNFKAESERYISISKKGFNDFNSFFIDKRKMNKEQIKFLEIQTKALEYFITENFNANNLMGAYWNTRKLQDIIEKVYNENFDIDTYFTEGVHVIYFDSKIDNKFEEYVVNIPRNYNNKNLYPLIINLSTERYGVNSFSGVSNLLDEPVIYADVTLKGVNCGSYIGELSALEILNHIKKLYSIDEDRIYITGCSNGGYGVWNIIQNYPHLFAGAYPLAGVPYNKKCKNFSNIFTATFASEKDHVYGGDINVIRKKIINKDNYKQINIKNMLHCNFFAYILNKIILNNLLKHKRNKFPKNIYFYTDDNRHLKSYWTELLGIRAEKDYAYIKASYEKNEIYITLRNSVGVNITLPPFINKKSFAVIINNKKYYIKDYFKDNIIFKKCSSGYKIIKDIPFINSIKGNGLLDVYMDSMIVLTDDNPSEKMKKCAETLAHPKTYGFDEELYVDYPVLNFKNINYNVNKIILCNDFDKILSYGLVPIIKFDKEGFFKNGIYNKGPYLIMQAFKDKNNKTILLISTNDENLYMRNIFTKKIIIPTTIHGKHKYLNRDFLIFYNNRFI